MKHLEKPNKFENIEQAARLFINNGNIQPRKISVVVDSDVDGFTSASLIIQYLKNLNLIDEPIFYVHDGKKHGIKDYKRQLVEDSSDLIIIPDAGSNDDDVFDYIKARTNKDILVLDHHPRDEKLSKICDNAIIINNQTSSKIKDKSLTGVGVAYKFCKYLDELLNENYADNYLDLFALGMIADRTDLRNLEARYLVLKGIEQIKTGTNKNKFISELIRTKLYDMQNEISIISIGFHIAPMINSSIRVGTIEDNKLMFKAFLNSDEILERKIRGKGIVSITIQEYVRRNCEKYLKEQKETVAKAFDKIRGNIDNTELKNLPVIIANIEGVNKNFTGLVANSLVNHYKRPCLCLKTINNNNIIAGSGRGFDKSSIVNFNQWCKNTDLFSLVQGHPNAFGCSIPLENIDELLYRLEEMEYNNRLYYQVYNIFDNSLSDITVKHFAKHHNVYGCGIEEPLFVVRGIICNKFNMEISSSLKSITFKWHNINFVKFSRSPMRDLVRDIKNCGDTVELEVVGKFILGRNKKATVIIENMNFKPTTKRRLFGG